MKITILDPVMCCSTGVCGEDIDDSLVETAAHVKWLKSIGHDVNRHSISNDAEAFKNYPVAINKLQTEGVDSLPYIFINDQLVMAGTYPVKIQWEKWIAADIPKEDLAQSSSCCSGTDCCQG